MKRSAIEISYMIREQLELIAATNIGLLFLNTDVVFDALNSIGLDPGSTLKFTKNDGSMHAGADIYKSLLKYRNNPNNNLAFMGSQFMTIISFVGDALKRNDYFNKSPELEFFRHLRNAISHGNTFHLLNGEPKCTARFNNISITRDFQGKCALFETVSAGDILELLEEIEKQLCEQENP